MTTTPELAKVVWPLAPVTEPRPIIHPGPTPGQLLSAMERSAEGFRRRVSKEVTTGPKRAAAHIAGFRFGWQSAIDYLKAYEEARR